jgi:hypothetical protein
MIMRRLVLRRRRQPALHPGLGPHPTAANNWGGNNGIAFNDPRMDALIDQAETELDPEKQIGIWAETQKIYAEQVRVLPLFFRADPHVVPKRLAGYTPTGHSDLSPLYSEQRRRSEPKPGTGVTSPLLSVDGLRVSFGAREVVFGVSYTLSAGLHAGRRRRDPAAASR